MIGRFSTFLEHVKPSAGGVRVTRFNALVPLGRAAGARNGSGRRSGPASYSDALLLAGGGAGIQERQHHGGGARHRQRRCSSNTNARSTNTCAPRASRWPTRMFSGAGGARSSPRKFRRRFIAPGWRKWRLKSARHEGADRELQAREGLERGRGRLSRSRFYFPTKPPRRRKRRFCARSTKKARARKRSRISSSN